MRKEKTYNNVRFNADILREAVSKIEELAKAREVKVSFLTLDINHHDSTWSHDDFSEFIADYRKFENYSSLNLHGTPYSLIVYYFFDSRRTVVTVGSDKRDDIHKIYEIFDRNEEKSRFLAKEYRIEEPENPKIFIGHGRSDQWKFLKDHLQDKHDQNVIAYESGARAGHTIRDILEEMAEESSFALLVMTAEDEQADGKMRARQNVVHEAGLFQGHLGFSRAIILLEEGVEELSNLDGIQYIPFAKGNIKESFGDVLATIKREFG